MKEKTEELELKIAQIIMTILPGYWDLPATPGRDLDADWAELTANCKELCLSRAREIVGLLENEDFYIHKQYPERDFPEDNILAKYVEAMCPYCGEKYFYEEGGYKPKTCLKYECRIKRIKEINDNG